MKPIFNEEGYEMLADCKARRSLGLEIKIFFKVNRVTKNFRARIKIPTLVCLINVQVLINVQGGKWVKIK